MAAKNLLSHKILRVCGILQEKGRRLRWERDCGGGGQPAKIQAAKISCSRGGERGEGYLRRTFRDFLFFQLDLPLSFLIAGQRVPEVSQVVFGGPVAEPAAVAAEVLVVAEAVLFASHAACDASSVAV